MDDNPGSTAATPLTPRRTDLLTTIRVDPTIKAPLGGLNPYSPHFDRLGQHFHKLLIEQIGLTPHHRVLDVGCGTGRLAKPLLSFLQPGNYHGFDVHPHFIDYCRTTYAGGTFTVHDLRHDEYNPTGAIDPLTFEFPYERNTFDVVVVLAVFNHFYTNWVCHYLRQITRILRPRGTLFATALLLNRLSIPSIEHRTQPPYHFRHRLPESWHDFPTRPLFNVAQPEDHLRRVCIRCNLMIKEPIRYGDWCTSKMALAGPDVMLARKNGWLL